MKGDLRQPANAERLQAVLILEPAELALDGGTSGVQVAEASSLARDQRVAPMVFDPDGLRLALPGGAAPLGGVALEIGTGERPA